MKLLDCRRYLAAHGVRKSEITLPIDQCREVGIRPRDEYRSFVADGRITIVRKVAGAARGFLGRVAGDSDLSDQGSLLDALDESAS